MPLVRPLVGAFGSVCTVTRRVAHRVGDSVRRIIEKLTHIAREAGSDQRSATSPRLGFFELCRQANESCILPKSAREEDAHRKSVRSPMQRHRH